jgi:hypothetical protein
MPLAGLGAEPAEVSDVGKSVVVQTHAKGLVGSRG